MTLSICKLGMSRTPWVSMSGDLMPSWDHFVSISHPFASSRLEDARSLPKMQEKTLHSESVVWTALPKCSWGGYPHSDPVLHPIINTGHSKKLELGHVVLLLYLFLSPT